MRGATCFSGIGAPEVAMPWVDWKWHSEIEPFPCAVMAHRHPGNKNLGDVLAHDFIDRAKAMGPLDIMVGGPPCQAFSIAGLRQSLADPRGNLSLRWVQVLHAIRPTIAITENVPGWLSTGDNAFGCFLAGIVGADAPLNSPLERGRWPNHGMVSGPLARAAWRILDAQFVRTRAFPWAVPQRRRRVFVVISFGAGGPDPAAILFDRESLRGNPAPRREAGQIAAPTLAARTRGGGGLGTDFDCDGGLISTNRMVAFGEYDDDGTASAIKARDFKDATDLVAHSLRGEGFDASEDGTGRGTPLVPIAIQERAVSENPNAGPDGKGFRDDGAAYTLEARSRTQAIAFPAEMSATQVASTEELSPALSVKHTMAVVANWRVRRLTPVECERLMAFPDGYTAIPWNGKDAENCPDGLRYRSLGNSMAVNVMDWLGERIALIERAVEEAARQGTS